MVNPILVITPELNMALSGGSRDGWVGTKGWHHKIMARNGSPLRFGNQK